MSDFKQRMKDELPTWIVTFLAAFLILMVFGLILLPDAGATPGADHKVTICHATGSESNPYVQITVDIASSGYLKAGHSDHADDIIPPYTYTATDGSVFVYPGQGDQTILANGCETVDESPSPTVSPTPPPPTTPPPTTSTWTPSWVPTPPGTVSGSGGGTAFTGADVTAPAVAGVMLFAVGMLALWYARKLRLRG